MLMDQQSLKSACANARMLASAVRKGLDVETSLALDAANGVDNADPADLGTRVDSLERELRELLASVQNWRLANNLLHEQRHEAAKAARAARGGV